MLEVRENNGITLPYLGGDMDPNVRADMVYFKIGQRRRGVFHGFHLMVREPFAQRL